MKSKGSKSFRKWRARVSSSSLLIWHCLQSDLSGILRIASLARTSLQKKHKEVKTDSISPKPPLPLIPLQPECSTQHHPKKVCKFLWLSSYHFLCPESHLCHSIYQSHVCYKWPALSSSSPSNSIYFSEQLGTTLLVPREATWHSRKRASPDIRTIRDSIPFLALPLAICDLNRLLHHCALISLPMKCKIRVFWCMETT